VVTSVVTIRHVGTGEAVKDHGHERARPINDCRCRNDFSYIDFIESLAEKR
jgi:hypothetical protein